MHIKTFSFFLILLLLPTLLWAWPGQVIRVTDGDTIVVLNEDRDQVRVRLYGIDAPESDQPYGDEATKFVRDLVFAEQVEINERYLDRYGRTIATVFLPDGTVLGEALIRAGFAWVYPRYCDEEPMCSWWDRLQEKARKSELGLWAGDDPLPPWEWRRKR